MKRTILYAALTACILVISFPATAQRSLGSDRVGQQQPVAEEPVSGGGPTPDPPMDSQPGPPPSRIHNRVVDLLDDEIVLTNQPGANQWVSESFDTAQFDTIALRFSAEFELGTISCWTEWKYSSEDEFQVGQPSVTKSRGRQLGIFDPPTRQVYVGRPDGIGDVYPGLLFNPVTDLTDVRGLQARILCWVPEAFVPDGIGDDPNLPGAEPASFTLSDVKVLLRRQ